MSKVVHVKQSSHNIAWDQANVVKKEGNWKKGKIKERIAMNQKERKNSLNLDKEFQIDSNWFTLTESSKTHT